MKTLIGLILLAVHSPYLCAQSQVQKSWVRHYSSGLIPGSDYAVAIEVQWEALDLPCGVYFYRLQAGNESVQARKLLLLK